MTTSTTTHLRRKTKIIYGAGDFGFSLTDSVLGVLFAIFLTDVVGLDPGLAAIAIFVGRSWDYVNDPLIGYLSDRTRSRWGRRRPFLLFGCLPFALAFTAMWWVPPIANPAGLAAYYAMAYFFYDLTATLVYMPYYALTPELTPDYDERTSLTSYRMAFSILGGLIAFTVPLAIIGTMTPERQEAIFIVGAAIGILSALPLLLTFWGIRERKDYQEQVQPRLVDSLKAAFRNRPFLFAMGIFLFTWAALEVVQGMLLYFVKYWLKWEDQSDLIAGTVFVFALFTLPFWDWASRRWDKRRAYIIGMLFLAAVMITLVLAQSSWGLGIVLFVAMLAGIGIAGVHVLPWSMIPDAIEWDELHTGQRHEGMFYSLVTLLRKVSASLILPLILVILDGSGYVANSAAQTPSALLAIRTLTGLVPAIFLLGGIAFALVYPIDRKTHARIREELADRKALDLV